MKYRKQIAELHYLEYFRLVTSNVIVTEIVWIVCSEEKNYPVGQEVAFTPACYYKGKMWYSWWLKRLNQRFMLMQRIKRILTCIKMQMFACILSACRWICDKGITEGGEHILSPWIATSGLILHSHGDWVLVVFTNVFE